MRSAEAVRRSTHPLAPPEDRRIRPSRRANREAAATGACAGLVAALVFGVAHGMFITWAVAPFVAAGAMGSVVGALCGVVLGRARREPSPLPLGILLMAIALPVGAAAFLVAPVAGTPPWLVLGTLVASVLAGATVGAALRAGWWGVVMFAAVGFVVGGPGEPFLHEGPQPRIVGFYCGLVLALGAAGIAVATFLRLRRPTRPAVSPARPASSCESRLAEN